MRNITVVLAILLPSGAVAGGFERDNQAPTILFNDGRYMEFQLSHVNVDVSGTVPLGPTQQDSGDVTQSYTQVGFAYKAAIDSKLDWSFSYAEPYGADISYNNTDPAYPYSGSWAKLDARSLTALLKYKFNNRFSVFGGARLEEFDADAHVSVTVPNPGGGAAIPAIDYDVNADRDVNGGYVLGAAFEKKEIALRVALTYSAEIAHKSDVVEVASGFNAATGPYVIPETNTAVKTVTPQSLNLSFQSGVNEKTLVFGSVHWVDWSENDMTPPVYFNITGGSSLVSHEDDTITIKLGVARRLNANTVLAMVVGHEDSAGKRSSNLSPSDGFDSLTFAGTYTEGQNKLTAGISLLAIGDTYTNAVVGQSNFSDNKALGMGISYGYSF